MLINGMIYLQGMRKSQNGTRVIFSLKKEQKPRLRQGHEEAAKMRWFLKGEGTWGRGSHLPWSKPRFGVKVGKQSRFHLESRLLAAQPWSPKRRKVVKYSTQGILTCF